MHLPVDIGRIGLGAARSAAFIVRLVDDDVEGLADLGFQLGGGNFLLVRHEALPALLLHLFRHRAWQLVCGRAFNGLVLEAADAVELGFGEPVEQVLHVVFRLAGEADDEGGAQRDVRADVAPALDPVEHLVGVGRAAHVLQHGGRGVLEGNVEVGQDLALRHQRDHLIHMRIGVNVVQAYPCPKLAQFAGKVGHVRAHLAALPRRGGVLEIEAVGGGILADDQQFLRARRHQLLRLAQHGIDRARGQIAANGGNNAEGAAVVAAFGNLQVAVVARRQLDALFRHEVDILAQRRRDDVMHRAHHFLVLLRAGDGQHVGEALADQVGFLAEAAGDDHLAVLGNGLADGLQRFFLGAVEEAAGVHQHHVRAVIVGADLVAVRAQLGQNPFGVDQSLRTA